MSNIDTMQSNSDLSNLNEEQKMTTISNSLNEQLFTDLISTDAEVIQGGHKFEGWLHIRYSKNNKRIAAANFALPTLKYNNEMSFIHIRSGVWRVYDLPNYKGQSRVFGPGKYNLTDYKWPDGSTMNDDVSSLKKI